MVEVDRLETVAQEGQLAEAGVAHGPVRQQACECGEDVERRAAAHSIGGKECWNEHVGAVGVDGVGLHGRSGIAGLDAVAEGVDLAAELVERLGVVAVVRIAHALEGAADGDGGHGE